jgi:hypothetical protein
MDRENRTNFRTVRDWMKSAGQNVPDFPYTLMGQVYSLRRSLIEEEALVVGMKRLLSAS